MRKSKNMAKRIVIRTLQWRESDLKQILEIENASFNPYDAYTREDFFRFFSQNPDLCLVAEIDSQIAGDLIARKIVNYLDLVSFAIHPSFRRMGVGSELLHEIIQKCKLYDLSRIELEVRKSNAAGLSFWRKMGFLNTGVIESFYEDGEDAMKMCRQIINE